MRPVLETSESMDMVDLDESVCPSLELPFGKDIIYALVDPRNMIPRYVGATGFPRRRYWQHLKSSLRGNKPKDEWIRSLLFRRMMPIMKTLEVVEGPCGLQEESWIHKLNESKMLFNCTSAEYVGRKDDLNRRRMLRIHRTTLGIIRRCVK